MFVKENPDRKKTKKQNKTSGRFFHKDFIVNYSGRLVFAHCLEVFQISSIGRCYCNYKINYYLRARACVCVCVFISFHRRGFSWPKQNNKCNARDQISDFVPRKLLCVKNLLRQVIDNHSRDLQASNCARVSVKPGGATRSKRQLLILSKTQLLMLSKSAKHSYLPPH